MVHLHPSIPCYFSEDHYTEVKHRGFAFVTYASPADAQDAIDNMDLNELNGRVLKVNLARQIRAPSQGAGNRASKRIARYVMRRPPYIRIALSLGIRRMA